MMGDDARIVVINLMNQKTKIEEEISRHGDILRQNGVGMNEPLIDNEGYPIATIDVFAVRHARQKIICLQNDYKMLLREIDNALGDYYQGGRSTQEIGESAPRRVTPAANSAPVQSSPLPPFAKVVNVVNDSPADRAGLQNGDLLIQFGSVSSNNFKDMSVIASVVQHSENSDISVTISRDRYTHNIKLQPRKWAGRGLLGCTILPLENIDR